MLFQIENLVILPLQRRTMHEEARRHVLNLTKYTDWPSFRRDRSDEEVITEIIGLVGLKLKPSTVEMMVKFTTAIRGKGNKAAHKVDKDEATAVIKSEGDEKLCEFYRDVFRLKFPNQPVP